MNLSPGTRLAALLLTIACTAAAPAVKDKSAAAVATLRRAMHRKTYKLATVTRESLDRGFPAATTLADQAAATGGEAGSQDVIPARCSGWRGEVTRRNTSRGRFLSIARAARPS